MDSYNIYLLLSLTFILGAAVGSFVTLASHRLPLGEDIIIKPSHCPSCHHRLGFNDLFPLFSWIAQKGKCRYCKTPVSRRYPAIELATGISFVAIVAVYGVSMEAGFLLFLLTSLAIMIVTDLEHTIIPDTVQLMVLCGGIGWRMYDGSEIQDIIIPVLTGLVIGLALHYGYLILRHKDALGLGDVKFLAAAGSWITLTQFVPFLFLAGLTGTFFGLAWRFSGRGAVFPFGPALAVSLFINVLFPDIMFFLQRGMA